MGCYITRCPIGLIRVGRQYNLKSESGVKKPEVIYALVGLAVFSYVYTAMRAYYFKIRSVYVV